MAAAFQSRRLISRTLYSTWFVTLISTWQHIDRQIYIYMNQIELREGISFFFYVHLLGIRSMIKHQSSTSVYRGPASAIYPEKRRRHCRVSAPQVPKHNKKALNISQLLLLNKAVIERLKDGLKACFPFQQAIGAYKLSPSGLKLTNHRNN